MIWKWEGRKVDDFSFFFEKNRTLYYDNLMRVREKNDITQWFKFFLVGIIETAQKSIRTFDGILKLQKDIDLKIQALGNRIKDAQSIINYLYRHPIIGNQKAIELTELSAPTVYKLIAKLEELGIIKEITGGKRNKLYLFEEYIELFKL